MASMSVVLMGFGLGHLERENLRRGQASERDIGSQRLRHAHGDGGLSGAWRAGDQDRTPCDLALLDHFQDHSGGLSRLLLAYQALGGCSRFEGVRIDAEPADV
ncbi:hypothetical protein RB594_004284 [Gaeumannomyces avenae]